MRATLIGLALAAGLLSLTGCGGSGERGKNKDLDTPAPPTRRG